MNFRGPVAAVILYVLVNLNWFVARYTGFEKSACRDFFSNVGAMDSQEDSASAVSPGLLVSLVDVYEHKRCLNWICSV